jgi:hypothetical protein
LHVGTCLHDQVQSLQCLNESYELKTKSKAKPTIRNCSTPETGMIIDSVMTIQNDTKEKIPEDPW